MNTGKKKLAEKIQQYHFELKHVLVLFIILAAAQVLVSFVHKISLQNFLVKAQDSYQRDSAERLANLTATSLELLLETSALRQDYLQNSRRKIIEAFNIILSQQLLLRQVEEICVLVELKEKVYAIDNGRILYNYFWGDVDSLPMPDISHSDALKHYHAIKEKLKSEEQIYSILEGRHTFHVFVPLVPKGEVVAAVYMKNSPDFNFITREIISSYNESSLIFTALILFGLLAMFYISSYTVRERDETQELLFQEREKQLKDRINYQKEAMFTKRIYHTHHKAEKVMGFIKEDLRIISEDNLDEIKNRVEKYANFISRVIYDMKWYEPPIQAIRNPLFRTNLNDVIKFIVENICLRNARKTDSVKFEFNLDRNLPVVHINEFVVWEILEPLLQNCMDHNDDRRIIIKVVTKFDALKRCSEIEIMDNGKGIHADLLKENKRGIKKIFLENITTKEFPQNSGYGCYIAYEIAKQRCGWDLNVKNLPEGGCNFTITILNS